MAITAETLQILVTADTKKAENSLKSFATKSKKVGQSLTKFVTLPIAAAGVATLKFAIDAEETAAKFGTAFRGIEDQAQQTSESLAENYGLANQEAQRLLAGTGDLLKGFGASADVALDLSNSVQELAVDLASYNNLAGGAEQASTILTKALLGERESLTTLGIKISEVDVQQELLRKGQEKLTGQARLLARAEATLALAAQQSGDAQGDFARTSDSAANQIRILRAEAIDAATSLGKELLPAFTDLLGSAVDLVRQFNELDSGTKKFILGAAAIAAAAGPISSSIGTVIGAVGKLQIALTALAANPGFAAIAGGAAIVTGTLAVAKALNDNYTEKLKDANFRAQEVADSIREISILVNEGTVGVRSFNTAIKNQAKNYGITKLEVLEIAKAQGLVNDEILDGIITQERSIQSRIDGAKKRAALESQLAAQRKKQQEQAKLDTQTRIQQEQQLAAERDKFEQQITERLLEQSGNRLAILEQERTTTLAEARRLGADTTEVLRFYENEKTRIIQEQNEQRLIEEQLANQQRQEEQAQELLALQENELLKQELFRTTLGRYDLERIKVQEKVNAFREAGAEEIAIQQFKEKELTRIASEESDKRRQTVFENINAIKNVTTTVFSQLEALTRSYYDEAAENAEDLTEDQKKEARKAFKIAKAAAIIQTVISTAEGAVKAYTSLAGIPVVGPALGAAAAATLAIFGGIQIAKIKGQQPAFQEGTNAEGFTVPEGFPNDTFNVGVSSGETVNVQNADEATNQGQSALRQIVLQINGRAIGDVLLDLSSDRIVTIDSRAIVTT